MKLFNFLKQEQMSLQSILLWIVAILNWSSDTFWFFAIAAILFGGVQDILNELRKLNNQKENGES